MLSVLRSSIPGIASPEYEGRHDLEFNLSTSPFQGITGVHGAPSVDGPFPRLLFVARLLFVVFRMSFLVTCC